MLLVSQPPQHLSFLLIVACLTVAIHIGTGVLALTVRPDIVTGALTYIIAEVALEESLVLVELDRSLTV